jgi:hypothetical protein
VKQGGWNLQYVPEHLKTAELCLEAVKRNGLALGFVPEHLKTVELCLEAVRHNPIYRRGDTYYVPEGLREGVSRRYKSAE